MPNATEVGLGSGHIVLDGDSAPPKWGHNSPHLSTQELWPNGWMEQDATWYGIGLSPGHIVLDGDPAPPPNKGVIAALQLSARACCGQTAGRIKMPLGMEVGLGSGHIVLDGVPAPPHGKGHSSPPTFRPMCIVAKPSPIIHTYIAYIHTHISLH